MNWYLIYTLWLGFNSPGQEIMVAVRMPDEATCMLETEYFEQDPFDPFMYAAEVLEGPPDPNNPKGLYREMTVLSTVCKWEAF